MNLRELTPHLLHQFKSEADLVKAIQEISFKFTRDRGSIDDYLNDARLVSAYSVFYALTNIPKLQKVFQWMPQDWIETLKECDFVDLGAGPGTYSMAWKEMGAKGDFYQIETARIMREQGRKIWNGLYSGDLKQSSRWEWKTLRPKFLLFGHSANEMTPEEIADYISKIDPEHILFIEPGTKEFFPKMLRIRDYLLQQKFNVLFPCPTDLDCPMRGDDKNWCHQFIHVKQEDEVERLSQMVKLDRKLLPLTVHAYSRSFSYKNPQERLVRVLPETKFSLEWDVCHNNDLQHYQVMKRDLSKAEVKALNALLSGEAVVTEVIKIVDHFRRVKFQNVVKL